MITRVLSEFDQNYCYFIYLYSIKLVISEINWSHNCVVYIFQLQLLFKTFIKTFFFSFSKKLFAGTIPILAFHYLNTIK